MIKDAEDKGLISPGKVQTIKTNKLINIRIKILSLKIFVIYLLHSEHIDWANIW